MARSLDDSVSDFSGGVVPIPAPPPPTILGKPVIIAQQVNVLPTYTSHKVDPAVDLMRQMGADFLNLVNYAKWMKDNEMGISDLVQRLNTGLQYQFFTGASAGGGSLAYKGSTFDWKVLVSGK